MDHDGAADTGEAAKRGLGCPGDGGGLGDQANLDRGIGGQKQPAPVTGRHQLVAELLTQVNRDDHGNEGQADNGQSLQQAPSVAGGHLCE